jgi:hypothetical protein
MTLPTIALMLGPFAAPLDAEVQSAGGDSVKS